MVDSSYANYLENLQQPAGWFDLVLVFTRMMAANAEQQVALDFLCEAGYRVALRYPLPEEELLSDLQSSINSRLDLFKWGVAEIEDCQDSLLIHHHYPPLDPQNPQDKMFLKAISSVLSGLYTGWIQQSGASAKLSCRLEQITPPHELTFRFKNFSAT
ncbi:MAG: hypothetical protein K6F05_02885 [Succinivibrio sp.]|nr:hypothetical protein [Succinivibrio sp.]